MTRFDAGATLSTLRTMDCSRCRAQNAEGRRFCGGCGAPLAALCRACKFTNEAGARFCGGCGTALLERTPLPAFSSPDTYTPKHLAQKILSSRGILAGERKFVTVLFADMKGSMELLADRDPEEARTVLDPVLELMMEAIHRYEGTVNQVMGDGIMALFGAPLAHEDHAVRACHAALRMQERVSRYSDELVRAGGPPAQIRIGLNSGEVVVRSIGNDLHMDYSAVGQTTHLAARLEQLATPGSVVLSATTLDLARGHVDVHPLGPLRVKGMPEPVKAYELTAAGPIRRRFEAATLRGLTRFVGREAELDELHRRLDLAAKGEAQVVAIVGEPGVGKSRLLHEFTRSHRAVGWLTLESGAVSYGRGTPYLPMIDLLKTYFGIESPDDAPTIRNKVTGRLLSLDGSLQSALPAVLWLLEVPDNDPQWPGLDPLQRRQRTLQALRDLFRRQSEVQPLCVVIEDLHWIDSETQAFLNHLIEEIPATRLLLLINYRPEYEQPWARKAYCTELRIEPLRPESAEELLEALIGMDRSLDPLKHALIERTQGNPFFLEESVRTLVETGVLVGERNAYRLTGPVHDLQVPTTVQAVLAARIDRLPLEDKRLLQAASVIGENVPFILLKSIVEQPEDELRRCLSRLQASEFIYAARLFPDIDYAFKHGLTYRVAYNSLLRDARVAFHARIVEAVERLYADCLAEHVDELAHHAFLGEQWAKAVGYLRQAGEKAFGRSGYQTAAAWYEQALTAVRHLPETRVHAEQSIDLRFELRSALLAIGEHDRILEVLCEAEEAAQSLGDARRTGWSLVYKTIYFWNAGEPERSVAEGQRALSIAQDLADSGLEVVANIGLGWAYHALGQYAAAITALERTGTALVGERVKERFGLAGLPAVVARTWLAWCHTARGDFRQGLARAQEGFQIAKAAEHPYSLAIANFGLGMIHLRQGAFEKVGAVLEQGLNIAQTFGIRAWFTGPASALGYAFALAGRPKEAIPLLRDAVDVASAMRSYFRQSERVAWLSAALLLDGRKAEAAVLAQQALDLARKHKERGHEAEVLRLLGDFAAREEPPDEPRASMCYREALSLAHELGMRPLIAHCHLGLGELYRDTAWHHDANEHLLTAMALYDEMDMPFWRHRAEGALQPSS